MLLNKYAPKNLTEFVGNEKAIEQITRFIKRKIPVLIHGPSGSGKSTVVRLIAKEMMYEVSEVDPSEISNEFLLNAMNQKSLFYKGKIILVDEVDALPSVKGVVDIINKSKFPVVLTAINAYESKIRTIRQKCKIVKFNPVPLNRVAELLEKICIAEGFSYERHALFELAKFSKGDVRAAIMDLELLEPKITLTSVKKLVERNKESDLFKTVADLLKTNDVKEAKQIIEMSRMAPDDVMLWLEENIPGCFSVEKTSKAFEALAKADIFRKRTERTISLYKYYLFFLAFAAASDSKTRFLKMPKYFKKDSQNLLDIAKKLHLSVKEVKEILPLIENLNLL